MFSIGNTAGRRRPRYYPRSSSQRAAGMSETASSASEPSAPSGERRQVTALFADMVGFTAISERVGEEGTFALIQPIYELMAAAVREEGGSVKDFTGDGIMALFGVPDALEDAPLRACRAGLGIHERLAAAAAAIEAKYGVRPQMRIGVNSGLAVVTQVHGPAGPATALGDTVNLAARLQTLAEPGTVFLSEATQRLVEGLVETSFAGAHAIKGKTEPQRVYRLEAIRRGAVRFDAALGRGLSAYVGRERELEILERDFTEMREKLRVVDIVAEPGMGKSRLLHEFRQRIGRERAFVLAGNCSPDGQQTPFLPFIEVVRGSFQVKAGEAEDEIARKLANGLDLLGLQTPENLGLLLNLLGLNPPQGALTGLDGVLIGLRTRDLLQNLLAMRCRLSPVVLLIEDLHWIDSVSQELLGKIVENEAKLSLLILLTRRPEFQPPWRERPEVTTLALAPLPAGDIRRLAETRLGVEALPDRLARQLTDKAEGNALFAEEILSFLSERGVLRVVEGRVQFDGGAVASTLPASVQSLLTARVDRLAPRDRALLQAAAVLGRRFDPLLLAVVTDDAGGIYARLAAMQGLDLIYPEGGGDYAFKHALVRDALYQSLLTKPRAALHLKIAEEIERRAGNRLPEVVETLAHHFGETDRADKAFKYLAMAGAKSLGVYSFDEAGARFGAAIALLDAHPGCADDRQIVEMLSDFVLYANASWQLQLTTSAVERFRASLDQVGDNQDAIVVQHHHVIALISSGRYREAETAQDRLSAMAARLGDAPAIAYAHSMRIHVSVFLDPPLEDFDAMASEAIAAASRVNDPYLQYLLRFANGLVELFRGRVYEALSGAEDILALGRALDDPRSISWGMLLRSFVASFTGDFVRALEYSEIGVNMARTQSDIVLNEYGEVTALVSLGRPEAQTKLEAFRSRRRDDGSLFFLAATDGLWGIALAMRGDLGAGIGWIEASIARREEEGLRGLADQARLMLCEIYLRMVSASGKLSLRFLARNLGTILRTTLSVESRVTTLVAQVRENSRVDPNGVFIGQCEMILGLLYKAKKKRALAEKHLSEAKRIVSQFGPTSMLARIDAALAEVGGL
jgi:class 3 adenylate cyclase